MTYNTGGKKKHLPNKTKTRETQDKRLLTYKDENQEYAKVIKALGQRNFKLMCFDNKERIGHVRGSIIKRTFINEGNIILVSLRDFQDNMCDIIHKYNDDEVRILIKEQHIKMEKDNMNDDDIIFEDEENNEDINIDFI